MPGSEPCQGCWASQLSSTGGTLSESSGDRLLMRPGSQQRISLFKCIFHSAAEQRSNHHHWRESKTGTERAEHPFAIPSCWPSLNGHWIGDGEDGIRACGSQG